MWQRVIAFELVDRSMTWNAKACGTFSISNIGNTNVTIMGQRVLQPGEMFVGPAEHPEIRDYTPVLIIFDAKTEPNSIALAPGATPNNPVYNPGDPPPAKDNRVLIMYTILTKE